MDRLEIEEAPSISNRLEFPHYTIKLGDLSVQWFHQVSQVTIASYGFLAGNMDVLSRIRGAWGAELKESASPQALDRKPCPWNPPCALDIFFREQLRLGKHGIAKPFTLSTENVRGNLVVSLAVFGFACDWMPVADHALKAALRNKVPWARLARNIFLPEFVVSDAAMLSFEGMPAVDETDQISIEFLTPMDASGFDPIDNPATVIGRLARRVDNLARWQDSKIDINWVRQSRKWKQLDYDVRGLIRTDFNRNCSAQKTRFTMGLVTGELCVEGNLSTLLPLLMIGQSCHVGKAAVNGFGRFKIKAVM